MINVNVGICFPVNRQPSTANGSLLKSYKNLTGTLQRPWYRLQPFCNLSA